jgi:hypothetical protein
MRARSLPGIDGDVSEWQALPVARLNATAGSYSTLVGQVPTLADLSAELRTAWTADTLYFAAASQDDVLVGNNSSQIWGDDVIELSVYVPSAAQTHLFTLAVDGRKTDNGVPTSTLTMVTRTVPGGWTVEAAVPASALGLGGFAAGDRLPFTFALWDDDLFTYPGQTHLFWQSNTVNAYRSDWGILEFSSAAYAFPEAGVPPAPIVAIAHNPPALLLTWQHLVGVVNYQVWRSSDPFFSPLIGATPLAVVPAPVSGLTALYLDIPDPNANSYYSVRSVNAVDAMSGYSNSVGIFRLQALP